MSIENLILGVNIVTVSYLIHHNSLLQNATETITKCGSYFILQNARFITNCDSAQAVENWLWDKNIKVMANRIVKIMKNFGVSISFLCKANARTNMIID